MSFFVILGVMDHTQLFFQLVASYEQHTHGLSGASHAQSSRPALAGSLASASAFTRAAAEVGRDLHTTASRVHELTRSA